MKKVYWRRQRLMSLAKLKKSLKRKRKNAFIEFFSPSIELTLRDELLYNKGFNDGYYIALKNIIALKLGEIELK